jgi:periplasmic protein TonB
MTAARALPRHARSLDPETAVRWGVAGAVLLHLLLLALLSVGWSPPPERAENPPMEVDLIAEVDAQSSAPQVSPAPPAPKLGEVEEIAPPPLPLPPPLPAPPVKAAPLPPPPPKATQPRPAPVKAVVPKMLPSKAATPKALPAKMPPAKALSTKAVPAKAPPAKAMPTKAPPSKAPVVKAPPAKAPPPKASAPTGRLDGVTDGMTRSPPAKTPPAKGAPATVTAAEVRKSIDVAIDGKILPHWRRNVPSGIDIDQLRVVLQIRLNQDGSVADVRQVGELTGKTDSNLPQQALFVERAIRAIRQASPFALPSEYYDQWRVWDVTFRARGI